MISVVVPIYNEEENIAAFHCALENVLSHIADVSHENWEVIYVNDGSRDSSLSLLMELHERDPRLIVVEFARNFGHQAALSAGLETARGDAVILMDGDFQDPPEVLPDLVSAWKGGAKVIIAERTSRAETGLRGKLFPLFYKVMGWISDFPIPMNAGIFGLLDRQPADAIIALRESNRYLPGMRAWVGFPTAVVYYDRAERAAGEAKQTLFRLIKYAMDAIFSFSYKPLRLGLALGSAVLSVCLVMAAMLLVAAAFHLKLFSTFAAPGTLLAILLMSGVQLVAVGLLGEYIGRIYDEVRRRPLYLVHKLHRVELASELSQSKPSPEITVRVQATELPAGSPLLSAPVSVRLEGDSPEDLASIEEPAA
jgi:dolichol-phosphate mannosyltransferase